MQNQQAPVLSAADLAFHESVKQAYASLSPIERVTMKGLQYSTIHGMKSISDLVKLQLVLGPADLVSRTGLSRLSLIDVIITYANLLHNPENTPQQKDDIRDQLVAAMDIYNFSVASLNIACQAGERSIKDLIPEIYFDGERLHTSRTSVLSAKHTLPKTEPVKTPASPLVGTAATNSTFFVDAIKKEMEKIADKNSAKESFSLHQHPAFKLLKTKHFGDMKTTLEKAEFLASACWLAGRSINMEMLFKFEDKLFELKKPGFQLGQGNGSKMPKVPPVVTDLHWDDKILHELSCTANPGKALAEVERMVRQALDTPVDWPISELEKSPIFSTVTEAIVPLRQWSVWRQNMGTCELIVSLVNSEVPSGQTEVTKSYVEGIFASFGDYRLPLPISTREDLLSHLRSMDDYHLKHIAKVFDLQVVWNNVEIHPSDITFATYVISDAALLCNALMQYIGTDNERDMAVRRTVRSFE